MLMLRGERSNVRSQGSSQFKTCGATIADQRQVAAWVWGVNKQYLGGERRPFPEGKKGWTCDYNLTLKKKIVVYVSG